jgi:Tfp pilus assembly protein PilV
MTLERRTRAVGASGTQRQWPERELIERFDMSCPIDQIDNSSAKPFQTGHRGRMNSRRSQSDVHVGNCQSQARRDLPTSLTASLHGPVTPLP